jgi:hypothetical protein
MFQRWNRYEQKTHHYLGALCKQFSLYFKDVDASEFESVRNPFAAYVSGLPNLLVYLKYILLFYGRSVDKKRAGL